LGLDLGENNDSKKKTLRTHLVYETKKQEKYMFL